VDILEVRKISCPYEELNHNSFNVQHHSLIIKPTTIPQFLSISVNPVENMMENVLIFIFEFSAPNTMEFEGKTVMLFPYTCVCDFFQHLQVSLLGKHIPGVAS
jgi:hypothetical protein